MNVFTSNTILRFFGTSYTVGGPGWLFSNQKLVHKAYPTLPKLEDDSQWKYSFPGGLQSLFDENKVSYKKFISHAKEGFGLERIIREIYKLLLDPKFDISNSVLFIELTDNLHRRDTYFTPLKDHIIGNHAFNDDGSMTEIHYAHTWYKDSQNIQKVIHHDKLILQRFHQLTFNKDDVLFTSQYQTIGLITLLNALGVKYYFTTGPYYVSPKLLGMVQFDDSLIIFDDIEKYIKDNKLSHEIESYGYVVDKHHAGIKGNRHIAEKIYDFLSVR